jgi:hypothetical protein
VDVSLEKLIEMIEQRLGPLAANLMLGIIVLAVLGMSLHLINEYLLQPLWHGIALATPWVSGLLHAAPQPSTPDIPALPVSFFTPVALIFEGIVLVFFLVLIGFAARTMLADREFARGIRNDSEIQKLKSLYELNQLKKRRRLF